MSARAVFEHVAGLSTDSVYGLKISQHDVFVAFMNGLYAVVERHPKGCVVVHLASGDDINFEDFRNVFSACGLYVPFEDGIRHERNAGDYWLRSPLRRQVETLEELDREF